MLFRKLRLNSLNVVAAQVFVVVVDVVKVGFVVTGGKFIKKTLFNIEVEVLALI